MAVKTPRRKKPLQHGKRTTYVRGCRCDPCKEANSEYTRDLNRRKRAGGPVLVPLRPVNANPSPPAEDVEKPDADEPGRVEAQVAAEIQLLTPKVRTSYVGLIESALAMARIIDNPNLSTTHPSAQRQLMVALDKLHDSSVGKQGKLATVAAMSERGGKKNDATPTAAES